MADTPRVVVAIDVMGGDDAPSINLKGARLALEADPALQLIMVGTEQVREDLSKYHLKESDRIQYVTAKEVITMEDHASTALRRKKDSSIHVGLNLVKEGKAAAFISAGNSGAIMAASLLVLGRMADVERPAILLRLPTSEGYVIILDGGANVECKASHLVQFAEMGTVYASAVENLAKPRVGILSNGSEPTKGTDLTREAYEILKSRKDINCIGYVEGYDLFRNAADVVICDGFVGNVVLKFAEGLADSLFQWFRSEIKRDILGLAGMVLMKRLLKKFRSKFDYEPYGAAPLVGIEGLVLISHGSSTEVAIQNGLLTAKSAIDHNLLGKMKEKLTKAAQKGEKTV